MHIIEQYHPPAHVGKHRTQADIRATQAADGTLEPGALPHSNRQARCDEIKRPVGLHEVANVRKSLSKLSCSDSFMLLNLVIYRLTEGSIPRKMVMTSSYIILLHLNAET